MNNAPKISVIMPSYLGYYARCANNRDAKILRAIKSVVAQNYENWELIIIADGCEKTVKIVNDYLSGNPNEKIIGYKISKNKTWAGVPRNTGISLATGEIICYLDIDDYLGENHLKFIAENFINDWVWFNEIIYNKDKFIHATANIHHYGKCGTCNIAHKKNAVEWEINSKYSLDDWAVIQKLNNKSKGVFIGNSEYYVCHIPNTYDI